MPDGRFLLASIRAEFCNLESKAKSTVRQMGSGSFSTSAPLLARRSNVRARPSYRTRVFNETMCWFIEFRKINPIDLINPNPGPLQTGPKLHLLLRELASNATRSGALTWEVFYLKSRLGNKLVSHRDQSDTRDNSDRLPLRAPRWTRNLRTLYRVPVAGQSVRLVQRGRQGIRYST